MNVRYLFLFFLFSLLIFSVAAEELNLPPGLIKIKEYNQQYHQDFALKATFALAFLAGILTILSPCILPFIPAYFAVAFKEKKNITLMTLVFFLGLAIIFVALGALAGKVGEQSLTLLQDPLYVSLAGLLLIGFGIYTILGKGFSGFHIQKKTSNDIVGIFLFGIFFAIGWSACTGPILAGILGISVLLGNITQAMWLMFFYALGNVVPIFIISIFYDKYDLSKSKLIRGKEWDWNLFGKEIKVHSTNMISGLLLILFGAIFIIFKGTQIVNTWDIFNTKTAFFNSQGFLMEWGLTTLVGSIAFFLFVAVVGWFFYRRYKED